MTRGTTPPKIDTPLAQRAKSSRNMICAVIAICIIPLSALSQGQDSTPWERDLLVLNELLPGRYDNVDQHYFERRRGASSLELHIRAHTKIQRVTSEIGSLSYLVTDFIDYDPAEP